MTKLLHGNEKSSLNGGREPLFSQKELLVLAVPLLVEQLLEVTVGMADTMMVSRCGEAAISGVSLVDMINNLIIVLFAALATGGAVVVSQYLGAKDRPDADKSAGQLLLLSGLSGAHRHFQQLLHQQRDGQYQQFLLAEQRLPPAGLAAFFIAMQ